MKKTLFFALACIFFISKNTIAQEVRPVEHFDKVIVSPHVKVTFTKGDTESVTIESCSVSTDKINIESNGKTLRVYLDGAKEVTKNEKGYEDGQKGKKPLYKGTVLVVAITYKTLEDLSVRGEETIVLKSKIDQEDFGLNIYGTSSIYFDEVVLQNMHTTIYGESYLELKSGSVTEQKFTAYGESRVNTLGIKNNITRATLYGESELNLNVSAELKITAFGEAKIRYTGDPVIKKGIAIGNVKIEKIDQSIK